MESRPVASVKVTDHIARGYFSGSFLWAAAYFGVEARKLEDDPERGQQDPEHESCVIASILNSAGFLEATVNEWFDDVEAGYTTGHIASLAPFQTQIANYWKATKGLDSPLEKYEELFKLTGKTPLPQGAQPWQGAQSLMTLRNELVHRLPASFEIHRIEKMLKNKFPDNKLMAEDTGHPWWPYHCLGAGCAKWSHDTAVDFAERVADELGINPKYRLRMRKYQK